MTYAVGENATAARRSPRNRSNPKGIGKDGIGDKLVADLTKHDIARVLEPIWNQIPETARRVRARIEAVIRWADGKEERDRANGQWIDKDNGRCATPHGLRATFRTWVQEETDFPREIAVAALAHVSGDEVERA